MNRGIAYWNRHRIPRTSDKSAQMLIPMRKPNFRALAVSAMELMPSARVGVLDDEAAPFLCDHHCGSVGIA
jgi:hypothetical protein